MKVLILDYFAKIDVQKILLLSLKKVYLIILKFTAQQIKEKINNDPFKSNIHKKQL